MQPRKHQHPPHTRSHGISSAQAAKKQGDVKDGTETYAALDLGTNNCRLLIAKVMPFSAKPGNSIKVIDSFSRIVRLGEGLSANGKLSDDAMNRTVAALRQCKNKLDRHSISKARFVATEACRKAANTDDFLALVQEEAGITIDIISNEEEARLAFLGCSTLLSESPANAIVFDIGGGSTEFLWVGLDQQEASVLPAPIIRDWRSISSGVMNLSEKFGGNRFAEMYFGEMVNHLVQELRGFDEANGIAAQVAQNNVQMLSTSGTVTTLAAIHLELPRYERARIDGITLSLADVRKATQTLLKMRPSERFNHPCIGSDRADYILSGCAIFEAICTLWPISHITIADRGVREGIILSLLQEAANGQ